MTFGEIIINLGLGLVSGVVSGAIVNYYSNKKHEAKRKAETFVSSKQIYNRFLEVLQLEAEVLRKTVEEQEDVHSTNRNIQLHSIKKTLKEKPEITVFDKVQVEYDGDNIGTVSSILKNIEDFIKWELEINGRAKNVTDITKQLREYELWLIRCRLFIRLYDGEE